MKPTSKNYRVYNGKAEQAIIMRLVRTVAKTGKAQTKTDMLNDILLEAYKKELKLK